MNTNKVRKGVGLKYFSNFKIYTLVRLVETSGFFSFSGLMLSLFWATAGLSAYTPSGFRRRQVSAAIPVAKDEIFS
nr:hypothetical protein [Pedobacter kyonggii]